MTDKLDTSTAGKAPDAPLIQTGPFPRKSDQLDTPTKEGAMKVPIEFRKQLEHLINRHSIENIVDIPDFILAGLICDMIEAIGPKFKEALGWHGVENPCHRKAEARP